MPLARKIGKRPTYLISILCLCLLNMWGYLATSYASLLASRVFGGFLGAAADAPVPGVVADLFFHHERGHALMMFHFAIAAGGFGGPLINGYVVDYLGWRWICGVMAVAAGATLPLAALLIRETAYVADGPRDLDRPAESYPPRRGWVSSLSLTGGFDRKASLVGWVLQTIQLAAYPPAWVAGLTVGVFVGW